MVDAQIRPDGLARRLAPPGRPTAPVDLQAAVLRQAYLDGTTSVAAVVEASYARIAARRRDLAGDHGDEQGDGQGDGQGDDGVWITLVPMDTALRRARELDALLAGARADGAPLPPLFGLPFAVKDNIDVAGYPTTAGCEAFAYHPRTSAPLVDALVEAGAVLVGKTNLDQFAAGLSGARSPYGIPTSPFDRSMIVGGSSSGSGVAVADGLVTFAIGTDTAGSGRVPAALTNTVGLKPTRGLVSTTGVLPACRSLDCPSVFALSVADARAVLAVIEGFDPTDPYSRPLPATSMSTSTSASASGSSSKQARGRRGSPGQGLRVGVARDADLEFFGDVGAEAVYRAGVDLIAATGAAVVTIDVTPFLAAGALLYGGPWLAERNAGAVGEFLAEHPGLVHPVTRAVLGPGATVTGVDVFRGITRLAGLRRATETCWHEIDVLVLPTVGTTYRVDEMLADPIRLNADLGRYTTFVNLLDLAAIAVPTGFAAGLPFGVSLIGPAGTDGMLADLAEQVHARSGLRVGVGAHPLAVTDQPEAAPSAAVQPDAAPSAAVSGAPAFVELAVVGAHMSGLALNGELTRTGASLVSRTRTTSDYRLFALPPAARGPRRPGLVRVSAGGAAIDAEIWRMPVAAVGSFLTGVPAPLAIGTVDTEFGRTLGVVCEAVGAETAEDVTAFGGWRRYLAEAGTPSAG